jgi:hypothetical protein
MVTYTARLAHRMKWRNAYEMTKRELRPRYEPWAMLLISMATSTLIYSMLR